VHALQVEAGSDKGVLHLTSTAFLDFSPRTVVRLECCEYEWFDVHDFLALQQVGGRAQVDGALLGRGGVQLW